MKNKVFLVNFPQIDIDLSEVSQYYQVSFHSPPLEKFHFFCSQALFVYQLTADGLEYDYFKEVYSVKDSDIKNMQEHPLKFFDQNVGRDKILNPLQTKIIKGSIVRSKADSKLGPGVVKKELDNSNYLVHFPKAAEYYKNKQMICHGSALRILTHIGEVKNEAS